MNGRSRRRYPLAAEGNDQPVARRHKPDFWILILSALLALIGLVVVYSISPGLAASQGQSQSYFVIKQLLAVALGGITFFAAAIFPLSGWKQLIKPLTWLTIAGCLVVMVTPINATYPAHRWIRLGSFSFQIAELVKLTLLLTMASFLTNQWRAGKLAVSSATLKPILALLLVLGVVVAKLQSDLGSAGVMVIMIGMMIYAVGVPLKKVLGVAGLVAILAVLAVSTSAYRRERVATFLHPEKNCQTSSYQACQDLISVGSGGLFGLGLGNSVQAYGYQPEAANDSIFAIMGEKFGFIGTLAIVVIYGVFITRLKRIIEHTVDQFNRLVVVGVMAWLSTQAIINIGAMVGLLPLKGITLPLISQGGTSLVFLTAALGLVFQVSRYTSYSAAEPKADFHEPLVTNNSLDGRRVGRPYNANIVTRPRT